MAGGVLSVVGPDGAGKTTLIDALVERPLSGHPVMTIRRVGVLWRRTIPNVPVTEPHKDPPYSVVLSAGKVAYLYVDYLLGWVLRVRPFVKRGGFVILQRGWWDQAVDPLRYRLRTSPRLLWMLGRLLPKPDLLLILEASPEVVFARKTELSMDELTRQQQVWRKELPRAQRRVYLDAGKPAPTVLAQAEYELARLLNGSNKETSGSGWVGLPPRGDPRFHLPTRPRASALAGLSVYHPVTVKGRAGWEMARALARLGMGSLLSVDSHPPEKAAEAIARHVPEGGTVAMAATNHRGRHIALVLDRRGVACAVAKIATTEHAQDALGREAEALGTLARRVPTPLRAPSVLAHGEGVLLLEVVKWRARSLPWRLPSEVAHALGSFWAQRGETGEGFCHGDFAPWNLYRTEAGWALLDWEEAHADGPPFFDLWHYVVQGHALLGHPSERALLRGLDGKGWVAAAVEAYATGASLRLQDARDGLEHYLRVSARTLDSAITDQARGLEARKRLLEKVAI